MADDNVITSTVLTRSMSDILNRVYYKGERFLVKRGGKAVATLSPIQPARPIPRAELIAKIGHLKLPGDGYADDLGKVQEEQPDEEEIRWPS